MCSSCTPNNAVTLDWNKPIEIRLSDGKTREARVVAKDIKHTTGTHLVLYKDAHGYDQPYYVDAKGFYSGAQKIFNVGVGSKKKYQTVIYTYGTGAGQTVYSETNLEGQTGYNTALKVGDSYSARSGSYSSKVVAIHEGEWTLS